MQKWIPFFEPHFESLEATQTFISTCEAGKGEPPMLMMHQTQRLVSLAEDIVQVRKKDSLRVLFLLICAEAIAKLHDGVAEEGRSRPYTRRFFQDFVSTEDQETIEVSFFDVDKEGPLDLKAAVDLLYDIRCDVVHEGNYCAERQLHLPIGDDDIAPS